MRLIAEDDVEHLLKPEDVIAAVAKSYRLQASGADFAQGRLDLKRDDPKGSVLVLSGHSDRLFATKTNVHVYPEKESRIRRAQSLMTLWDSATCVPLALIATTKFNNHRTAAGLAVAADLLAPKDAKTLVVFGAGKIAPAAIRYLYAVRKFTKIIILGKGPGRSAELARSLAGNAAFSDCAIGAGHDAAAATREADVIVTLTTSSTAVFPGYAVKPGALVILAGANKADAREADDDLMGRAYIYVDHMEKCLTNAGDIAQPLASGALRRDRIGGEIGILLNGAAHDNSRDADVTVFKSMGFIGQDIAIGTLLLQRAAEADVGAQFDPWTGACRPSSMRRASA